MQDILGHLSALRRPRTLVDAARLSAAQYDRSRDLPRLLGHLPRSGAAALQLADLEGEMDDARRARATGYRAALHLAVLGALMGEARHVAETRQAALDAAGPYMKASGISALRPAT